MPRRRPPDALEREEKNKPSINVGSRNRYRSCVEARKSELGTRWEESAAVGEVRGERHTALKSERTRKSKIEREDGGAMFRGLVRISESRLESESVGGHGVCDRGSSKRGGNGEMR